MNKYEEITRKQYKGVEMTECFWAFSNSQFDEGIQQMSLEGKKLYHAGSGLYGTKEGLDSYFKRAKSFSNDIDKEIRENCIAQDVYDYEFANHECKLSWEGDLEAIIIVRRICGKDVNVARRNVCED